MAMPPDERSATQDILPHDVHDILTSDPVLRELPIETTYPVSGGVAHRVYCIECTAEKYFLKIRGDHFAAIPSISCNPSDIVNEYLAIEFFSRAAPDHFPRAITFHPERHYLVVTDVIQDGNKLEDILVGGYRPQGLFRLYGNTLAKIHHATSAMTDPIRVDSDEEYYHTILGHRFGYRHHPILDEAVAQLSRYPARQLILADPAPKNMGIRNDYGLLTFFDLETAHLGNCEFDYAYGLAHSLLHSIPVIESMHDAAQQFIDGYGSVQFDPKLIIQLSLGIILYRLHSIIPYPVALSTIEKREVELHIENMLYQISGSESWEEIVRNLTKI